MHYKKSETLPALIVDQALCGAMVSNQEISPDAWHPERHGNPRPALLVCSVCPVRRECLDYGLRNEMRGVWGGRLL